MSIKKTMVRVNCSDIAKKDLIKLLKEAENYLRTVTEDVAKLRDSYEFPCIIEEIDKQINAGKVKKVTTAWLQRKFKVGYIRAAQLLDALRDKKIIQ